MSELKLCRICLTKDLKLFKLEQCNLKKYYEEITLNMIMSDDDLPQYFCFECATLLHKFHKFKEKCSYGQNTLKNLCSKGYLTYNVIEDVRKNRSDLQQTSNYINQIGQKRIKTITIKYKIEKVPLEMENVILNSIDTNDDHLKYEFMPESDQSIKLEEDKHINESKTESVITDLDTKAFEESCFFPNDTPAITELLPIPEFSSVVPENTVNHRIENISDTIQNDQKNNRLDVPYESDDNRSNDANFELELNTIPTKSKETNKTKRPTRKAAMSSKNIQYNDDISNDSNDPNFDCDPNEPQVSDNDDNSLSKGKKPKKTIKAKKLDENDAERKFVGIIRQPKGELSDGNWETKLLTDEEAMDKFKKKEFDSRYEQMEFKCTKCFKGFSKNEMLLRHNKLWHDHGDNVCRFCQMQFKWKSKLQLHMRKHYYIYKCLRCGLEFFVKTGAVFHDEHHNGVTHTCRHCGEEYTHISTYYTHLRTSHRNAHACTICGETFVSEAGVVVHMKRKHVMQAQNTDESSSNIYCSKCKISFMSQSAYDTHLAVSELHEEENKDIKLPKRKRREIMANAHRCHHCDKKFNSGRQVRTHIQQEHPGERKVERVVCEICGAVLSTTYIHIHMNRHTRKKIFRCETCGKEFLCANSLTTHKLVHSGERPHACPICPKRFSLKAQMEVHYKRVHLKEPYPKSIQKPKFTDCPVCHKTFQSRSHMDTHLRRVHLKEPYPKRTYNRKNRNRQPPNELEVPLYASLPK